MRKYVYHVTDIANVAEILEDGLIAKKGKIFFFDLMRLDVHIARHYCALYEYALLRIDKKGITGPVKNDFVADDNMTILMSKHQFFVRQKCIKPEFITLVGYYEVAFTDEWKAIYDDLNRLRNQQAEQI
jgi:hypothetical protein